MAKALPVLPPAVRTRGETGLCGSERQGWGGHGPGGAPLRQASPPGSRAVATGARTREAVGCGGAPRGGPRGAEEQRTGEPGLAQVSARSRTREEARPRGPSAAGGRLPLASAPRPSPRFPLPHTHTRTARLMPPTLPRPPQGAPAPPRSRLLQAPICRERRPRRPARALRTRARAASTPPDGD